MVESFIKALIGIASGEIEKLLFLITADNDNSSQNIFEGNLTEWTKENALNRLEAIVQLYEKGLQQPYPFSEFFYREITLTKNQPLTVEIMIKKISDAMHNPKYNTPMDSYLEREEKRGFLDEPDAADNYNYAFDLVVRPLFEIFPVELWERINKK